MDQGLLRAARSCSKLYGS